MHRHGVMLVGFLLLVAACGGEAPQSSARSPAQASAKKGAPKVEACALLTPEEIEAAVGWKPDSADPKTYGSTRTCHYQSPPPKLQSVVLVVATPVPKLASSAAMAEWRTKQAQRQPDFKVVVTPVEGLGAPAIRSEVEDGPPTIEAAVNGLLLGVTAPTFEAAKALSAKAIARLR